MTSLVAQPDSDCTKEEASSEPSIEAIPEKASHTTSNSASHHTKTMAAEAAQPLASLQEASADTTPQNNLPAALTKQVDASTPPAKDRLSPMESPEPAEVNGTTAEDRVKGPGNSATAAGTSESKTASAAAVKTKKKEDKSIENILPALSSLNSPEEKLAALCKKYADLHEEHRVVQTSFKSQQRKMTVDQREKDKLLAEHIKAAKVNSKLESLCRELQKQNKTVKEESILRQKEEEEKRKEISLAHAAVIMKEQEEKHLMEKELLHLDIDAQLSKYKERYEEFQGTINNSNDLFKKLKSEMDKMGKRIKKLEKEGAQWRAKWEASNKALLDMAEEKTRSDKEKQLLQTKIIKLELLCRALQGEQHGNKSTSPQPPPSSTNCSKPVPSSAPQDTTGPTTTTTTTSSQASTTVTPPNTPEENTSRASPNPDSPAASLPTPSLPTGQNGPVSPASSLPVPSSSTEEEAESELAGQGESCTTASTETSQSSSPDDSSVSAAAEITTTQQSDQAEASSSSSAPDQSVSPSAENEAHILSARKKLQASDPSNPASLPSTVNLLEIQGMVLGLVGGGLRPASTALDFCVYCLAMYPQHQDTLVREIFALTPKLPQCAVNHFAYANDPRDRVARTCLEDCLVGGVQFRFSKAERQNRHPYTFIPFGAGPRMCVARRLGLLQVKVAIVSLLQRFKVIQCLLTSDPLTLTFKPFLCPKDGVWVNFELRSAGGR
ncbi:hypothetical protein ACOMHN_046340 [Nucella lapillus]